MKMAGRVLNGTIKREECMREEGEESMTNVHIVNNILSIIHLSHLTKEPASSIQPVTRSERACTHAHPNLESRARNRPPRVPITGPTDLAKRGSHALRRQSAASGDKGGGR